MATVGTGEGGGGVSAGEEEGLCCLLYLWHLPSFLRLTTSSTSVKVQLRHRFFAYSHWFMALPSGHLQYLAQHTNLSLIVLCFTLQRQGICIILVIHWWNPVVAQLTLKEWVWTEAGEIGRENNVPQDDILAVKTSSNTQKKYKVPDIIQNLRKHIILYLSQRQTHIHPSG